MRNFPDWIDGFVEYSSKLPSPEPFRRWVGISIISSALERKVWIAPYGAPLYPNTYIFLVAPPGVGKSVAMSNISKMFEALPTHHVASDSVTKPSLMDELNSAKRAIVRPGQIPPYIEFNFLNIVSSELGVFLPSYDNDFMSALTHLWDGHGYSERRRSSKIEIKLPDAQLNLIAGTTPAYLASTLPQGAWDQGFLSRAILVFSGEEERRPLFEVTKVDEALEKQLREDLKKIGELYGLMKFEPAAARLISDWHMAGGPPQPEHPRLAHYLSRRTTHLLKLCMIMAASARDELIVTEADFIRALDLLVETEAQIPEIFKAMTVGGDQRAIEELWYWAMRTWTKEKKAIQEHRIITYLSERVPVYNVDRILQVMVRGGLLEQVEVAPNAYKPRMKH